MQEIKNPAIGGVFVGYSELLNGAARNDFAAFFDRIGKHGAFENLCSRNVNYGFRLAVNHVGERELDLVGRRIAATAFVN